MLKNLHVKNLALIEDADIGFSDGLNILTGETGAGKSLLMGSVLMAMGSRVDASMIRKGAEQLSVELVFDEVGEKALSVMNELDIPPEDDGCVIVKRTCSQTKSSCRVNGSVVALKEMKKLSQALMDVHGQRDYETLLHRSELLDILDIYCGKDMQHLLDAVSEKYLVCKELRQKIEEESSDTASAEREVSLAEFELGEIEEASLKEGEDDELETLFRRMSNYVKIAGSVQKAHDLIGSDADDNAGSLTSMALKELLQAAEYDESLSSYAEELRTAESILSDLQMELGSYISSMEFDEEEFARIQERLDLINKLKNKYGRTIPDILSYAGSRRELLEKYADYDAYMEGLNESLRKAQAEYDAQARKVTALRKKNAPLLQKELTERLKELNFLTVDLKIRIGETQPGPKGTDQVDFMISVNPGEDRKPISEVASGGELSRMMLAVKTVMAGREDTGTLIFDEIDSGISGITAWKVSGALERVSRHHQVICITHLPQIAAMADHHFIIVKSSDAASTTTDVLPAGEEESVSEIARLLGTDCVSESSLKNARELIEKAGEVKKADKLPYPA
ncbi:MAG: DNA repair protein RecN [Lachnospiraceae bacterium]|nr:DNA repair protein RecN [Lachnospiraceae bacterium]